jgi:hypothetical protein
MTRKELHHRLLSALGVTAAGAVSLGSGPCGSCFPRDATECIDLADYQRWLVTVDGGTAPGDGGAGGASGDECPTVADFVAYAKANNVEGVQDVNWKERMDNLPSATPDGGLSCCYSGEEKEEHCAGGRPFLVGDEARQAELVLAGDREASLRVAGPIDDSELTRALAAAWLRCALTEHASVAAFARLSLQLLSHGAPLELVAGAHHAALDEIRHATHCLARAHRYTSRRFSLGALDVTGCLERPTLVELARLDVLEGCVGETIAAAVVAEQAARARDPELARELHGIAEDESRHAALAWRVARWALESGGSSVRCAVVDAFRSWRSPALDGDAPTPLALALTELGHLDRRSYALAAAATFSEVVLPLARELLASRLWPNRPTRKHSTNRASSSSRRRSLTKTSSSRS